jgi:hypothetical protein
MYVDGGCVIAAMNILKIQSDYGDNFPNKGILEKLKEKGKAWPFIQPPKSRNLKHLMTYNHLRM